LTFNDLRRLPNVAAFEGVNAIDRHDAPRNLVPTMVVVPTITVVHAITHDRTDIGQSSNCLTNDVSAKKAPGNVPGLSLIGSELSSVRFRGVKRTLPEAVGISANDPERTLRPDCKKHLDQLESPCRQVFAGSLII
jgi:hypothetical protein